MIEEEKNMNLHCYTCKKWGHTKNNCPHKRSAEQRLTHYAFILLYACIQCIHGPVRRDVVQVPVLPA